MCVVSGTLLYLMIRTDSEITLFLSANTSRFLCRVIFLTLLNFKFNRNQHLGDYKVKILPTH